MTQVMKPEALARKFHETYERLAPQFGYSTRDDSRVPWENVPEANKRLMVAVAQEILVWVKAQFPPSERISELLLALERVVGGLAGNEIEQITEELWPLVDALR